MKIVNKNKSLEKILVKHSALEKLFAIARIMEDYEFRVTSTGIRQEPGLIHDFYIPPNQKVGPAQVSSEAYDNINTEIRNRGQCPVGFAHGHGSFGVFHSPTDDANFDKFLKAFKANKKATYLQTPLHAKTGFQHRKSEKKLSGFDELYFDLLLDEDLDEQTLSGKVQGRVLKSVQYHISSIVVNQTASEIFGIKRFREDHYLITDFDAFQRHLQEVKRDKPNYFIHDSNQILYSVLSEVEIAESSNQITFTIDDLVKELKEKIVFSGSNCPSIFKPKVSVPKSPESKFSQIFFNYIAEQRKYSGWAQRFVDHLITHRSILDLEQDLSTSQDWTNNPELLEQAMQETIIDLPPLQRVLDDYTKGGLTKGKYTKLEEALERHISKARNPTQQIIKCNPIEKFDGIMQSYNRRCDQTSNYKDLWSENNKVKSFYQEFQQHKPAQEQLDVVQELIDSNEEKLGFEREFFLRETENKENILLHKLKFKSDKEELRTYCSELREIRDNYFSLGEDEKGKKIFSVLLQTRKQLREYG